jgi:hypoxanthine phosphoribosyltransferase
MAELHRLISEEEIARRVGELAERIDADYADSGEVVMVGVLKGAFMFLADLARRLNIRRRIEFMALSSYGEAGSVSSGAVRLMMDLRQPIEGRHVLVVEDIVDTGRTLRYLVDLLGTRRPASVRTAALVQKPARMETDVQIDYLGFEIPDVWAVGYGLDFAEDYRTLPFIAALEQD